MALRFTILGSAGSFGIPYAGNDWNACDPHEPKNRRLRASLLVQSETTNIIVDTGADFREQTNTHNISKLDAVLYTHMHSDHTAGVDDLRIYAIRNKKALPTFMDERTYKHFQIAYDYLLDTKAIEYPAILDTTVLKPFETFTYNDITIHTHSLYHNLVDSTGYRFGKLAYSLDMHSITDERTFKALDGIDTWIVDAGAYHSDNNPAHATIEKIIEYNQRVKAKRVILTSLTNRMDHNTVSKELPDGYEVAYDGLSIEI